MMFKKKKYYAVFLVVQEGSYSRYKKKRFRPSKNTVKISTGTYVLDVSRPTYIRGLKLFYFINIEKVDGQLPLVKKVKDKKGKVKIVDAQLSFKDRKSEIKITPRMLDDLISQHIIRDLSQNLGDNKMIFNIMTFVIGAISGGAFGFIIAGYV